MLEIFDEKLIYQGVTNFNSFQVPISNPSRRLLPEIPVVKIAFLFVFLFLNIILSNIL